MATNFATTKLIQCLKTCRRFRMIERDEKVLYEISTKVQAILLRKECTAHIPTSFISVRVHCSVDSIDVHMEIETVMDLNPNHGDCLFLRSPIDSCNM